MGLQRMSNPMLKDPKKIYLEEMNEHFGQFISIKSESNQILKT